MARQGKRLTKTERSTNEGDGYGDVDGKRRGEGQGGRGRKRYAGTDKLKNRYSKPGARGESFSCQAVDNESRSSRRRERRDAASIIRSVIRTV